MEPVTQTRIPKSTPCVFLVTGLGAEPAVTWPLARGLQLAELGDLVLCDDGHVAPEVHVLALLELHVHLGAGVQRGGVTGRPGT